MAKFSSERVGARQGVGNTMLDSVSKNHAPAINRKSLIKHLISKEGKCPKEVLNYIKSVSDAEVIISYFGKKELSTEAKEYETQLDIIEVLMNQGEDIITSYDKKKMNINKIFF